MSDDELFIQYLQTLETVLNGKPFLLHFSLDFPVADGPRVFDELVQRGVVTALVREYFAAVERGYVENEELYFYRAEALSFDPEVLLEPPATPARSTEISKADFRGVLLSTLDTQRRALGHFSSFYSTALSASDARERVDELEAVFARLGEGWRYYWIDTQSFVLDAEDPTLYFWSVGNDSCVVFHDQGNHFFVLLTSGTD